MPTTLTTPLTLRVPAEPLTRSSFARFGDVIENPHPDVLPSASLPPSVSASFSAVPANQGSAIKYQNVSTPLDLYSQAPSGAAKPIVSIFSCAARALEPANPVAAPPISTLLPYTYAGPPGEAGSAIPRHRRPDPPEPSAQTDFLPAPTTGGKGRGLPDLKGLKAFVAYPGQAVTYGAGTWHAPMVALGPQGTAIDFVVTQFASGVGVEDCQEVEFAAAGEGAGIVVQVPERMPVAAKL
ncbi:ureidoglycolate lyase [Colletotrichum liriopes]|uniref:Ureidoglycolate lyase n=1 Tax=Colletotrichum liriopes TaxID=708192 RepID=A0AA37GXG1_9PEZI|nr:ureidoglycolate lyase [Colletotrichum liriopes]